VQRNRKSKEESWKRRLAAYAAAGSAVAVAVPAAQASVIYTADANLVAEAAAGQPDVFVQLPLGGAAFAFTASDKYTDANNYSSQTQVEANRNGAFLGDTPGQSSHPVALAAGSAIGPGSAAWAYYGTAGSCGISGSASECASLVGVKVTNGGSPKNFQNWPYDMSHPQYMGLSFTDPGSSYGGATNIYYGWALVGAQASPTDAKVEVFSYAYNDSPNTPIAAGQTTDAIPEPGTLALMAMGAAGVAILKRRRTN